MNQQSGQVERFVRRVHRRMVAMRLLEAAGVGMLLSAAVAGMLMGVRMYRGEEALSVGMIVLALGAAGGLAWRAVRRPSRLEAAMEADRQLELSDLVSSAWIIVNTGREGLDFGGALVTVAERRCESLRPGDVVLRRLGARWWGSVGLAGALVVAVGLVSVNPMETYGDGGVIAMREGETFQRQAEAMRRGEGAGGGRRMGADFPGGEDRVMEPGSDREERGENGKGRGFGEEASARGAGSGSGRTARNERSGMGAVKGEGQAGGTELATGSGSGAKGGERDEGRGGGVVSGANAGAVMSPEREQRWSAARGRANAEIQSVRIPGEYHELIRRYFAREE